MKVWSRANRSQLTIQVDYHLVLTHLAEHFESTYRSVEQQQLVVTVFATATVGTLQCTGVQHPTGTTHLVIRVFLCSISVRSLQQISSVTQCLSEWETLYCVNGPSLAAQQVRSA